jgi:hypothetical protein
LGASGALLGRPLLGFGVGLLVVTLLLPRRLRPVDRRRLSVAAAACLAVGAVALEALR